MFKLILLIINLIYLANSLSITSFSLKLSNSVIQLDCIYKLGPQEKKTGLSISKDGQTFLHYDDAKDEDPKYTSIKGIGLVKIYGGCRLDILNYDPDTMGIYELQVTYNTKAGKPAIAKKLYKTSMKYQKCTVTWVNSTKDALPKGAFLAAIRENGDKFYPCRNMGKDETGYFEQGKGCVYTLLGNVPATDSFQILTGKGYSWAIHQGGNKNKPPKNTVVIGKDGTGDVYIGRCNYNNFAYIGKVTDNFYFNQDGKEVSHCNVYDVLVC